MQMVLFSQRRRLLVIAAAAALVAPAAAVAADRTALERDASAAFQKLIADVPAAKALSKDAVGVLVFPKITKAGFVVGGQYGDGVLFKNGKAAGYYNTTGASYGLQAGVEQYGYAMFLMTQRALNALNESTGFEIGAGPSVVVVDQAMGKSIDLAEVENDIYAFVFSRQGLMGGMGLTGNKITRLND